MWEPADFIGGPATPEEIAWERACAAGTNPDEATPIHDALAWRQVFETAKISASSWVPHEPQKKRWAGIMNKWR